ncbi:MAG TPA: hypothetical protein VMZ31_16855 [Phycisphaerae bacterium]|nr:hypothetical protein [Phycisphaerae bacterium]
MSKECEICQQAGHESMECPGIFGHLIGAAEMLTAGGFGNYAAAVRVAHGKLRVVEDPEPDTLMDELAVAELLCMRWDHVRTLVKRGMLPLRVVELPKLKTWGSSLRFWKSDVMAYLESLK